MAMRYGFLGIILVAVVATGCGRKGYLSGGQEQVYLILEDSTRATDVSWNPDGSKVAYSTGNEIRYLTLPSTQGTKVADTQSGILTTPNWSPVDPARIAYVKIDSVGTTATIIECDTLGQGLETVFTYTSGQLGIGFVSPESLCLDFVRPKYGTRIYVSAVGSIPGIWAIDTISGTISFLLEGRWPDVEDSETYLAYAAKNGGIRIRNLDSLTTDSISASGLYPSWSPDGEYLAYSRDNRVYVWPRRQGQLRGFPMTENISNLSWRNPPNQYHIAVRFPSDGTVWILSTLSPGFTGRASARQVPLEYTK
ncbi:hypothetical protein E3J62_01690 [candidate division TA06 bacterium]|uniref:Dipeptidylpeptidase IV N-terminal domain-containing protein n=1 Tax=candidate division TA06 bacterium TaxID=2250710 RepID=A0A523UXU6_UNCT6|nr:MAG: hypothetical protein E3J62_01690 [candidate division TA06 bacterium]